MAEIVLVSDILRLSETWLKTLPLVADLMSQDKGKVLHLDLKSPHLTAGLLDGC